MSKGKNKGAGPFAVTEFVSLPAGYASAVHAGEKLLAVAWERSEAELRRRIERDFPGATRIPAAASAAGRLLAAYSRGVRVGPEAVSALPYAWERVGRFDRGILAATLAVPPGETRSYGEIAAAAGCPGAARAAGAALARNPWPVLVPCHRVVGRDGLLTGFSRGLDAKRALLSAEGCALPGAREASTNGGTRRRRAAAALNG